MSSAGKFQRRCEDGGGGEGDPQKSALKVRFGCCTYAEKRDQRLNLHPTATVPKLQSTKYDTMVKTHVFSMI
eukprot:2068768-Amphidinium_carterae.1